jgi:hypothetical protein
MAECDSKAADATAAVLAARANFFMFRSPPDNFCLLIFLRDDHDLDVVAVVRNGEMRCVQTNDSARFILATALLALVADWRGLDLICL